MLLGVLDIGSNSAQLQVFEARPGAPPLPTHAVKEPTLLGESFDPDGAIEPAGVDRVVEAVNRAMGAARRLGVQQIYVFTTSAVRDAANRDLILDRVEAEAGVRPQYLGGEDEPELAMSLPLGAGRLTRLFLPDDPPSRDQLTALRRHVYATLREVADRLLWEGAPDRAVGDSPQRRVHVPAQWKGPFVPRSVTARYLDAWVPRLATLRARERAKLKGVSRSRSRQIVAGAIAARAGMKALNVGSVDICPWALREGIILHYLQAFNQSFDLPLRPLNGSTYGQDAPGGRHVTLVTTSSGHA